MVLGSLRLRCSREEVINCSASTGCTCLHRAERGGMDRSEGTDRRLLLVSVQFNYIRSSPAHSSTVVTDSTWLQSNARAQSI